MMLIIISMMAFLAADPKGGPASDGCTALLPPTLQTQIIRSYPGFRPVRASDYSAEEVEREREDHRGSPCLGVASADVDGDGRADFGLLITSTTGHTFLASARAKTRNGWHLEKLADFGEGGPGGSYVEVIEAGLYEDLGLGDEKEPGEVMRYKSTRPGFIAGTIESSGAAYFFTGKQWVHLWLSD